jgi:hypothetical protein
VDHVSDTCDFLAGILLHSYIPGPTEIFTGRQPRQGIECFPTFWELTPSPSSWCAGGLVAPKLMTVQLCCVYLRLAGHEI